MVNAIRWIFGALLFITFINGSDISPSEPVMIGEGIISTKDDEFGGAITPDGNTIYFNKSVPQSYLYVICVSKKVNGEWTTPEIAPFSGFYRDSDPVLSPDGSRLYFGSDRPVDGVEKKDFDIWFVEKTTKGWSEPRNMGKPINSDQNEYFASQASNGTMYFTSAREGNVGIVDVYRSRLVKGAFEEPVNMGAGINGSNIFNIDAYVSPDESFLFVAGWGHESFGDADIYISHREGDQWMPLRNLGTKVNTSMRDTSPRISANGKQFIFSSEIGLPSADRSSPITYGEFMDGIGSTRNGLGNIYQIDMNVVNTK